MVQKFYKSVVVGLTLGAVLVLPTAAHAVRSGPKVTATAASSTSISVAWDDIMSSEYG